MVAYSQLECERNLTDNTVLSDTSLRHFFPPQFLVDVTVHWVFCTCPVLKFTCQYVSVFSLQQVCPLLLLWWLLSVGTLQKHPSFSIKWQHHYFHRHTHKQNMLSRNNGINEEIKNNNEVTIFDSRISQVKEWPRGIKGKVICEWK